MAAHVSLGDYVGKSYPLSLELTRLVEEGLPLASIDELKARGLTFTEIAEIVISPRTLKHRRERGEDLAPQEAERVIRVASIVALAENVFGDPAKAMRWLRGSDDRLGGRTPLSMLRTESGGRLVESMLYGIDEGIFS